MESINYHYHPPGDEPGEIEAILASVGAQPLDGGRIGAHWYYVLTGPEHWVDLKLGVAAEQRSELLSVRVALCNPPAVLEALERLFEALLARGGHVVQDVFFNYRGPKITEMDEAARRALRIRFEDRRRQFRQFFDIPDLPIGANELFDRSADYHYQPGQGSDKEWKAVMRDHGVERCIGHGRSLLILRKGRQWVDLVVAPPNTAKFYKRYIWASLPLCEPLETLDALRPLVAALLSRFGGELVDLGPVHPGGGCEQVGHYTTVRDPAWSEICRRFEVRARRYRHLFAGVPLERRTPLFI